MESESNPEEKDLELLVDERLNMSQQCLLINQKANYILCCMERSIASRARKVILYCTLMRREAGCPASGSVQDHVGWSFGQPGMVGGVPAQGIGAKTR